MSKYVINDTTLTAIGDAVREKGGTTELIPVSGLANAIINLPSGGGGIEVEPIVLSGQCQYACANQVASTYIELFGDTISTEKIESSSDMFYRFEGSSIPFEVNMKSGTPQSMQRMFQYASSLEELPKINNAKPNNVSYMLYGCNYLRNIPEDWMDDWDFTSMHTSSGQCSYMFAQCYSLRKIPTNVLKNIWSKSSTGSYVPYNSGWTGCYALDELVGIPIQQASMTSNRCASMVSSCSRLKNLTFEVNEDGSPKTATWKAQTIDLSIVGIGSIANITNFNSGITADKLVSDDATYQALKNDPDWFTNSWLYSRYNHDSAVTTINSLPDCSATGTNTIKFKGEAGALTDGGAINTLTDAEIAVATAKGWTVTLV